MSTPSVSSVLLADVNGPQHKSMMNTIKDRDIEILQWLRDHKDSPEADVAIDTLYAELERIEQSSQCETDVFRV